MHRIKNRAARNMLNRAIAQVEKLDALDLAKLADPDRVVLLDQVAKLRIKADDLERRLTRAAEGAPATDDPMGLQP